MIAFLIILSGIYLLIIGGFMALGVGAVILSPGAGMEKGPILAGVIAFYAVAALWLFVTAVGIFCRKNWARVSTFVLSGFALFAGISTLVMMPFFKSPAIAGLKMDFWLIFGGIMFFFCVLV